MSHRSAPPYSRGGKSSPRRSASGGVPRDDNAISNSRALSVETGIASWYAPSGRRSANGDKYDGKSMTAAHRTLPLGTVVRVTNLDTNQSAKVRITDRGPFVKGRLLDLSIAAAKETGVYRMGLARVRVEVVEEPADVSPGGRWCVQVGAFSEEKHAQQLKNDMLRRYSSAARVIEFPGATGHWVRINPVASDRAHALEVARSIRVTENDVQAWLVRLD